MSTSRPVLAIGARPTQYQRQVLRNALIGTEWTLYQRSARYHFTVDALIELLPRWLDAIADEARDELEALANATTDRALGVPAGEPAPPPTVGPALLARLALVPVDDAEADG